MEQNRLQIFLMLIRHLKARAWLLKTGTPEVVKDAFVFILSTLLLMVCANLSAEYKTILTYSQITLYALISLLAVFVVVTSLTNNADFSNLKHKASASMRKVFLGGAYANIILSSLAILGPLVITGFKSYPNIVLGISITIITGCIALASSPFRPKRDQTKATPTELATIFNNTSHLQFNYSVVTKEDIKTLCLYQTARVFMLKFIRDLPSHVPLSIIDKNTGDASVYIHQNKLQSIEVIEWMMMFLLIGPTAERYVKKSMSTISVEDVSAFNRIGAQYLVLTKPGFTLDPKTPREEAVYNASLSALKRRTMDHCHRFLKSNYSLIPKVYKLVHDNDRLILEDLAPLLDKVIDPGIVPAEVALERINNPKSIDYVLAPSEQGLEHVKKESLPDSTIIRLEARRQAKS